MIIEKVKNAITIREGGGEMNPTKINFIILFEIIQSLLKIIYVNILDSATLCLPKLVKNISFSSVKVEKELE